MTSISQKYILDQNKELQDNLNNAKEDNITLRGELQDLEETLERTEKGVVFMKGLLNNLNEQNKLYKSYYVKFNRLFSYEQYVFFAFITACYAVSIYRNDYYLLLLSIGFCVVSKYSVYYENKSSYAEFLRAIEVIEKTLDPLHELIDGS